MAQGNACPLGWMDGHCRLQPLPGRQARPGLCVRMGSVTAICGRALALGWSEAQLCQNRGRYSFPCGQDYGLVCFLHGDDRVGEITHQSIEIINARGTRRRFYAARSVTTRP